MLVFSKISNLAIAVHPNATAIIFHENSNKQALLYEGTFTTEISGIVYFVKAGTEMRSAPAGHIAKVSTDNYYMGGMGQADYDTGSQNHTHYIPRH